MVAQGSAALQNLEKTKKNKGLKKMTGNREMSSYKLYKAISRDQLADFGLMTYHLMHFN